MKKKLEKKKKWKGLMKKGEKDWKKRKKEIKKE